MLKQLVFAHVSLRGGNAGNGHSVWTARHVVEPDAVEQVDRLGVTAVLATDAELEIGLGPSATLGADPDRAGEGISTFRGVHRRTEFLGERALPSGGAVRVYDDYGHHPTEVDATLRAIRAHENIDGANGRLVCVFQPHQHSRTRFLLSEFAQSFSQDVMQQFSKSYYITLMITIQTTTKCSYKNKSLDN